MKKLFYTMILLFVASLSISAQEATLVPRVTKSGSAGIGEVNENNDVYIDTNTTLSVVATLPSVSGTNVKVKITVKKGNGDEGSLEYNYTDSPLTISLVPSDAFSIYFKEPGIVTVIGSYTYEVEEAEQQPEPVSIDSLTVHIYEPLSFGDIPEPQELVAGYAPNNVTFSVNVKGGNPDPSNWSYQWLRGGTGILGETGSSYTILGKDVSTEKVQTIEYSVKIKNKAEDGILLLDTIVNGFKLIEYPAVKLNLVNVNGVSNIVSGYKDEIVMRIDHEGGPNTGWTYEWFNGDEKLASTDATCTYKPEAPSANKREDNIRVVVRCVSQNETTLYYNDEKSEKINVYQPVSFELYGLDGLDDFLPSDGRRVCLDGDMIKLGIRKTGGVGEMSDGNSWTVEWYKNNNSWSSGITTEDNAVNTQTAAEGASAQKKTNTYSVKLTNKLDGKVVYEGKSSTANPSEILIVDAYPKCGTIDVVRDTLKTCPNSNRPITVKTSAWGGYSLGWQYEWKRNGTILPNEKAESLSESAYENDTDKPINVVYTLYSKNQIGSRFCGEVRDTFTVRVWPAIKYDVTYQSLTDNGVLDEAKPVDLFVGDSIKYNLSFIGGNPDGWEVYWNGSKKASVNQQFKVVTTAKSESGPYTDKSIIKLINTYNGEPWLEKEINLPYQVFNRGSVDRDIVNVDDSLDIYAVNKEIRLRLNTHEGFTGNGAWKFVWKSIVDGEGIVEETTNTPEKVVSVPNVDSRKPMICQVLWSNSINNNLGSSGQTDSLTFVLWPEAKMSDVGVTNVSNMSIRNKESVVFDCEASGAYTPNGASDWFFTVYDNNQEWDTRHQGHFNMNTTTSFSGDEKNVVVKNYKYRVINRGPSGKIWAGIDTDYNIKVYREPYTPIQLKRKGNGSSLTFVITFKDGITDEILTKNDYLYVFGYTDANDKDHDLAIVNTRFYRMSNASEYNDPTRKYYAYSVWNYPDGARVTSNKRILNADEVHFDGSSFDNVTRADMTAVSSGLAEQVDIHGGFIDAHFDKPVKVVVSIYSARGDFMKEQVLGVKKDYNERIVLNGLTPGMYLLHYAVGSQVKVEKVVVK